MVRLRESYLPFSDQAWPLTVFCEPSALQASPDQGQVPPVSPASGWGYTGWHCRSGLHLDPVQGSDTFSNGVSLTLPPWSQDSCHVVRHQLKKVN